MHPLQLRCRLLAVVVLLTSPNLAFAIDDSLERAISAALRPVGIADMQLFTPTFRIAGHQFAVPPMTVVETGERRYVMSGSLTYRSTPAEGCETIEFRITKRRGEAPVVSAECRRNGGAWAPLATPLTEALTGLRTGRSLTREQQEANRRTAEDSISRSLDGSWKRAAECFIARLALGDGC